MANKERNETTMSKNILMPPADLLNEWLIDENGYRKPLHIMYLDKDGNFLNWNIFNETKATVVENGIRAALKALRRRGVMPYSIHIFNRFDSVIRYTLHYEYPLYEQHNMNVKKIKEELISIILNEKLIFSSYDEKYKPSTEEEKSKFSEKIAINILERSSIGISTLHGNYEHKEIPVSSDSKFEGPDMYDDYTDVIEYIINHD
ncbi:hypothetical protein BKK44_14465 [Bacillus cereus]|nr:hypothetical protein BKK44_14465 [Bacillus cereus]